MIYNIKVCDPKETTCQLSCSHLAHNTHVTLYIFVEGIFSESSHPHHVVTNEEKQPNNWKMALLTGPDLFPEPVNEFRCLTSDIQLSKLFPHQKKVQSYQ